MTKNLKLALLAGLAGAGFTAQAATYNQHLIVGFTAEIGNDLIYDLGAPTAITNGQTWDLSSLLGSFTLSTVKWGVAGATVPGIRTAYITKAASLPPQINGNSAWQSGVNGPVTGMYGLFPTAGTGQNIAPSSGLANSWNQQTIAGAASTTLNHAYTSPNITGNESNNFYRVVSDNSAPTLLGTFYLTADGKVIFTEASATPLPPPPPVLSITRVGTTSSISFLSTNSATYTLCFTNETGLTAPIANWPSQAGTISGDGTIKSFTDITTDPIRLYRVRAQ